MDMLSTARPRMPRKSSFELFCEECEREGIEESTGRDRFFNQPMFKWKKMSDAERQKYLDMEKEGEKKWLAEMKRYVPVSYWFSTEKVGEGKQLKYPAKPKDPYLPIPPPSFDYSLFHSDERKRLSCMAPEVVKKPAFLPFGSMLGQMESMSAWDAADLHTKLRYKNMTTKATDRFQREIKEYHKAKIVDKVNDSEDENEETLEDYQNIPPISAMYSKLCYPGTNLIRT